jgi:hypothetical protein
MGDLGKATLQVKKIMLLSGQNRNGLDPPFIPALDIQVPAHTLA